MNDPTKLSLGEKGDAERQVAQLVERARDFFAANDHQGVNESLYNAHAIARHSGLHRRAAELKQALTILASGDRPKLLRRTAPRK
jgi:hypothetical protein